MLLDDGSDLIESGRGVFYTQLQPRCGSDRPAELWLMIFDY